MKWLLSLFAITLLLAPAAGAAERVELAGMDVFVWSKDAADSAAQPVIIFSHGFHGCGTQSRFLMEAFAAAGYIVFAPNHRDATCSGGQARWTDRLETWFRPSGWWNESRFRDRADDVRRVLAAIRTDDRFRERADTSRLGLVGHSLGGYTVLGLAGAWPEWKTPGVKAVLALSPFSQPFVARKTLAGVSAPVMYQGGTWDTFNTPPLKEPSGAYEQSPEPKYLVEFDRAGHFAWTNMRQGFHDEIAAYGVAFMDHYVKGEPAAPILMQALSNVELLRYESEQGSNGAGTTARRNAPELDVVR